MISWRAFRNRFYRPAIELTKESVRATEGPAATVEKWRLINDHVRATGRKPYEMIVSPFFYNQLLQEVFRTSCVTDPNVDDGFYFGGVKITRSRGLDAKD